MKKLIYSVFILCISVGTTFGQYCGVSNPSGPLICTASGGLAQPGLSPRTDSLPPFTNGIASNQVIQFKNFNTVFYLGSTFTVQSLRIDSIENLPTGLCWSTDKTNNTYANQESGCIRIIGTPCAPPGQYKMRIKVTVNVGIPLSNIDAESAGLRYFGRLANYGDVVPACDTLQTASFYNVGYSPTANCSPVICSQFSFTQSATTNNSCAAPTGTISVTATGGTAPYTYYLGATNNTTGNFTGVAGGTFDIIAVDANTCRDTVSVTVPATTPVITVTASANTPQSSCTVANGALTVSAAGGTGPYTYNNGTTSNSTGVFASLASGNYTITATDANSCSGSFTATVSNTAPVVSVAIASSAPQTSCSGSNGTFTATATGGTAPYTYVVGGSNNTTGTFTLLAANNYNVNVTDANGCSGTISVNITDSINTYTTTTSSTNASSATATDGTATVTVSATGGTPALTYLWSDGQTTATATGLLPGTYTVTATDGNGCSVTASSTVSFNIGINSLGNEILDLNIFPNPVSDNVTLNARFATAKNVTLEILTSTGSKVLGRNIGNTDKIAENFTMKSLAKGTYFIVINADGKRASYPVVVE